MSVHDNMLAIGDRALAASRELAPLHARKKNVILNAMADALDARRGAVTEANRRDVDDARNAGLSPALVDRIFLNDARINAMIKVLRDLAVLKDPTGARISRWIRPNGLEIVKQRVPIGVIAVIYEACPSMTVDSVGLCVKTANAVILRGAEEAIHSNVAIADALIQGGRGKGLPADAIQLVRSTSRDALRELVRLEGCVDLVIPRGGEALACSVTELAHVPVIRRHKGVCHTYVDETADFDMALRVTENAAGRKPGVFHFGQTVLIHAKAAPLFLPRLAQSLSAKGIELRGDDAARLILPEIREAGETDGGEEDPAPVLVARVAATLQAAIEHINRHGSRHSDAIITGSEADAGTFLQQVDSAAVYVNASIRFTDGAEFGMGAGIGVSTDKLHARGPVGLEELTTYKYLVHGNGQVKE